MRLDFDGSFIDPGASLKEIYLYLLPLGLLAQLV